MNKKSVVCIAVLAMVVAAVAVAQSGGGGGMFLGYQTSSYPFLEQYPVANNSMDLIYYGGYGYGVSSKGAVAGGFGFAIMDVAGGSKIAGGFGGIISGIRLISKPISISLISWTGFGGISTGIYRADNYGGFFAFLEEVTLEIGVSQRFPGIAAVRLRSFQPDCTAGAPKR